MKSILISLVFLLTFSSYSNAQQNHSASISGLVLSTSGEVLMGANIILPGTTFGTSTNLDGQFSLNKLAVGSHEIRVSYVGYQTQTRRIQIEAGQQKNLVFNLSPSFDMPQIELIGSRPQRLDRVPGSAAVISETQIMETAAVSGHEVFRRIAGVHAVEEEGLGLRANIGVRGLDPSKSRSILMLEDGIPVALAPYGEPEMYYTPAMDRMAGVELVKGSGSILFGPQTFGGVMNYITADPPSEPTTILHLRGGEGGYFTGRFGFGTTMGNTGFNVTYLRKQGDNVGLLNYRINDLNSKMKLMLTDRSVLGIKFGVYDETSNSTYIGLSQPMYDSGKFDFTHLSPDDILEIRRYSGSVTHDYFINTNVTLRTSAYGYTTTRNWSRQDFDNNPVDGRDYVRIIGDTGVDGGAIFFRDLTGNRNRQFEVAGVEPRLSVNFSTGSFTNELDLGARYLFERAYEQRLNGDVTSPQSGILRDDEIRTGHALSLFAQNAFNLTESFSVTPGVRFEYFEYTRDIRRLGNNNTNIKNTDAVTELIPGIGFNFLLQEGISFYGGIHRGYGPPRVKDAISATGVSEELEAEKSWNYELGTRARLSTGLDVEITGFYMDFSNQIIPVSEAAGGSGIPGATLTNGGATEHRGVEASFNVDFARLLQTRYGASLRTSTTFVKATFSEDRFVNNSGETENIKGNRVPYAPEVLVSSTLNLITPFDFVMSVTGTYTGHQYGDALNREEGSLDGRQGPMPAHFILDARATYGIPGLNNANVSLAVKNLLDHRYIASRRPQGIRAGLPRFFSLGVDWSF